MTTLLDRPPSRLTAAPPATRRLTEAALVAAFTYLFLANTWLGDDAYITFRVVWNLLHGYGAVFNPGERVQAYTHPLWMLMMAGAHAMTREFVFTAYAVSYACSLAAVMIVVRSARSLAAGCLAFLILASSKAFIDYTSSGLENPLTYLLLAMFYVPFCRISDEALTAAELRRFGLLAGLGLVNRLDAMPLYAPALAWLAWRAYRRPDERVAPLALTFLAPLAAWLLFATIYYGFPLPNTYYAKVATGIPSSLLYRQGLAYVLNSLSHDPITLGTIGICCLMAVRAAAPMRLAAAATVLFVLYTISVGGDFMSGRFFVGPFLIAVVTLVPALQALGPTAAGAAAAALVVYNVLVPLVPAKTTSQYQMAWPWRPQNGIKDERGSYHAPTNILFYSPFRSIPEHTWVREGMSFRGSPEKVSTQGSIGYYGLMAGPDKIVLDRNALSDPLLARLPVSRELYFEFFVGHYFRDIPEGYIDSLASGENRLADPQLHAYYDRLRDVTRGRLFSGSRLASIWYLNAGEGRHFARRFDARRPVALSVRASNERFSTDVGERDIIAGTLRSTGRPGYLELGPGIPMKAGSYVARWRGTTTAEAGSPVGFVEVLADDEPVARQDILAAPAGDPQRLIGELPFRLDRPVGALEYRLWINGGGPVLLERVELVSARP